MSFRSGVRKGGSPYPWGAAFFVFTKIVKPMADPGRDCYVNII